jgi:hypothetical protein
MNTIQQSMTKEEVRNTLKTVGLQSRYSGKTNTVYVQGNPKTDIVNTLNMAANGFSVTIDPAYAPKKKATKSKVSS